jgi:hypothetical protein
MSWEAMRCVLEHLIEHASGLDQLVLIRMANHARKGENGGGITVGRRSLAKQAGISDKTVHDALERLRKAGLIEREGRGPNNTWRHRIVLCPLCKRSSGYSTSGVAGAPKRSSGYTETRGTPRGETHSQRMARLQAARKPSAAEDHADSVADGRDHPTPSDRATTVAASLPQAAGRGASSGARRRPSDSHGRSPPSVQGEEGDRRDGSRSTAERQEGTEPMSDSPFDHPHLEDCMCPECLAKVPPVEQEPEAEGAA